jgi:hypothetical protein
MTTFSDKKWEQREQTLGDPAEHAFEQYANRSRLNIVRYGLNRPPINMGRVPTQIRYTPDYLTDIGLVEVQGCGQDQTFKFKHDKLWAITQWSKLDTTWWFLWNQTRDSCVTINCHTVAELCFDERTGFYRTDGLFDGSKPYAMIRWSELQKVATQNLYVPELT